MSARWIALGLVAFFVLRRARGPAPVYTFEPTSIAGGSSASTEVGASSVYRPIATSDRSDVRTTGLAPGSRAQPGTIYRPSGPSARERKFRTDPRIGPTSGSRKV